MYGHTLQVVSAGQLHDFVSLKQDVTGSVLGDPCSDDNVRWRSLSVWAQKTVGRAAWSGSLGSASKAILSLWRRARETAITQPREKHWLKITWVGLSVFVESKQNDGMHYTYFHVRKQCFLTVNWGFLNLTTVSFILRTTQYITELMGKHMNK